MLIPAKKKTIFCMQGFIIYVIFDLVSSFVLKGFFLPNCFWITFFRGFIFWQNDKGGGGVIAKRF